MASKIRFNKSTLAALVRAGVAITVRDSEVPGLKFEVRPQRSVFQFEKRISGRKGSAITMTLGAFPAVPIEEARQEARRLANHCERGIDPRNEKKQRPGQESPILLNDALERFFEEKRELAPGTLRRYRDIIRHQFAPAWLHKDLRDLTPERIVQQFHVARKTARNRAWGLLKLLSNIWNTLTPIYKDDQGRRLLGTCPIPEARTLLRNIKPDPPARSTIPAEHIGKLIVMVEQLRDGILPLDPTRPEVPVAAGTRRMCQILLLSLFTGFRFNETRSLRWDYIDPDYGLIRLPGREEVPNANEKTFLGTKNRQDHVVPLSSSAVALLQEVEGSRSGVSPYIFPGIKSGHKPVARNDRVFKRLSELLGRHFSPHATRRTFASVANDAGLGYLTVKRMLNHSYSGDITCRYIAADFNPEKERVNFQAVDDYIRRRRAEYLGEVARHSAEYDEQRALMELRCRVLELGLDPIEALNALTSEERIQAA